MLRPVLTLALLSLATALSAQEAAKPAPKPTAAEQNAFVNAPLPADQAAMKAPDYLAINPMGKVPAIVHDGRVLMPEDDVRVKGGDRLLVFNTRQGVADVRRVFGTK